MPCENRKIVDLKTTLSLGLALLVGLCFRLLFISRAPGIHFDEAWAANYAAEIAGKAGFWPIDAMSPYTHPWSHYISALFFKVLGTHLWVSRLAGIAMSGAGIILILRALLLLGEKRSAVYFAWMIAACVPSVLNERFAIEINTFHVLCLGLLIYGMVKKSWVPIALGVIFGVTSHILFLAPVLAAFWVWACSSAQKTKQDRVLIGAICLILLPFFLAVCIGIPEKGKALTVIALDLGALFYVIRPFSVAAIERKLRIPLFPVVAFFLVLVAAMMEGDLSIEFTYGKIMSTWVSCLVILTVMVGSVFLLTEAWKRKGAWPKHFAQWMFYFIFLVGVMSTKPAPRYFEMVFVVILIGAAITLSRIDSQKFAKIAVVLFVVIGAVQWGENYILPALHHEGVDQSFRFLLFHDASSDSLSKQDLVDELGRRGCRPDQVVTSDPRLGEALKFLAIGDWKIDPENKCPAQQIKVERAATGAAGERFEEFVMQ